MNKQNRNALNNSNIFVAFMNHELMKEAKDDIPTDEFDKLENNIRNNEILRNEFKRIQAALQDPDIRSKTDPKFVESVMLLNLD